MKTTVCSLFILFLLIPGFTLCGQQVHHPHNVEVIEYTTKQYYHNDTSLINPFWVFTEKIWFSDSFAIEEVRQLNITEDSKGNSRKSYDIRHYRFSDLRKKMIYEFPLFGKTDSLIRKYYYSDSVPVVAGWGFNFPRRLDTLGHMINRTDTMIGTKRYIKTALFKTINDIPYNVYCFFDCSRTGTNFDFCPALSRQIACPLTKFYYSSPLKKGVHMTCEVNLISSQLTLHESQAFAAWKKYAEENP